MCKEVTHKPPYQAVSVKPLPFVAPIYICSRIWSTYNVEIISLPSDVRPGWGDIGVVPRWSSLARLDGDPSLPLEPYHGGNLHPPWPLHTFFEDRVWSGLPLPETSVPLSPTSYHRWPWWSEIPLPETSLPLSPTSSRRELWSVYPLPPSWGCSLAEDCSTHHGLPPRIITVSIKLLGDRDSSW